MLRITRITDLSSTAFSSASRSAAPRATCRRATVPGRPWPPGSDAGQEPASGIASSSYSGVSSTPRESSGNLWCIDGTHGRVCKYIQIPAVREQANSCRRADPDPWRTRWGPTAHRRDSARRTSGRADCRRAVPSTAAHAESCRGSGGARPGAGAPAESTVAHPWA